MEPNEIAEQISELKDEIKEESRSSKARDRLLGVYVGVLALMLALTNLGGSNATKDMLSKSIEASDTWNFYQAKSIRQTGYKIAAAELDARIAADPALPPEVKAKLSALSGEFKSTVERYESDPKTGEGRKELSAKAREIEHERDRAMRQDPNFDLAEAGFQIAVVLSSVALVTNISALLFASGAIALVGLLFMVNGFFLLVPVPIF